MANTVYQKKPFDKRLYNYRCARNTIQDQLDDFALSKRFYKGMRKDVHVGHLYSLANLFDDFLQERGVSHWQVKTARKLGKYNWASLDGPLELDWYRYHKRMAELRMQNKTDNIENSRADAYHIPEVISPFAVCML